MIYGLRFALVLLALAVLVGAFGAHAVRDRITPVMYQAYQTGVSYHFYHCLGMIAISLIIQAGWMDPAKGKWVIRLLSAGILLFSGSLYLIATRDVTGLEWIHVLGPVTPVGGLCFIAGWILAAIAVDLPVLRD
jgi:uncharacterized membrane protein YgdD (TMEM256/DUF423 family)